MKTNVFVYGTLMHDRYNHHYLQDAEFLGSAHVEGFGLFDLGSYPGMKRGHGRVYGELYAVDDAAMILMDHLEGEGRLYERISVPVHCEGKTEEAEAYLYLKSTDNRSLVPEYRQPWGCNDDDPVWYVCYGSNMLEERFLYYINGGVYPITGKTHKGCKDHTPPQDNRAVPIPYEMYFGNSSGSWGGHGVAFLDKDRHNNTRGRAWLVKRSQLPDIQEQEGPGEDWYDTFLRLAEIDGIPAYTLTNHTRRPERDPSEEYRNVIEAGLRESCW